MRTCREENFRFFSGGDGNGGELVDGEGFGDTCILIEGDGRGDGKGFGHGKGKGGRNSRKRSRLTYFYLDQGD